MGPARETLVHILSGPRKQEVNPEARNLFLPYASREQFLLD